MTEEMKIIISADSSEAQRKLKEIEKSLTDIRKTTNGDNFSSKVVATEEKMALRRRQLAEKTALMVEQLDTRIQIRRELREDSTLSAKEKRAIRLNLMQEQLDERVNQRKQHLEEQQARTRLHNTYKIAMEEERLAGRGESVKRKIADLRAISEEKQIISTSNLKHKLSLLDQLLQQKLDDRNSLNKQKLLEMEAILSRKLDDRNALHKQKLLEKESLAKERALQKELKAKENATGKQTGLDFSGIGKKLAGITALYKAGQFVVDSIKESIGAIESESLFQVSFKNMSKDVKDWSDEMSKALGLNATELRRETATTYDMVRAMNVGKNTAVEMAKGISLMSRDVASLRNEKPELVYHRFSNALMGMTRGAHLMGYAVTDANVKIYAYKNGIAKTGDELTESQKTVARYLLLLEQTKTAHGNLAQTLNSPANQLRMFNENLKTLSQTLGNLFIPMLNAVLPYINAFLQLITMVIDKIRQFFGVKPNEKFAKDLHPNMENLSDDMKELGDGADNFADGLKDSTKQAKKLQKELAKFDEMNVLNEKKTPKTPKMSRWQKLMQGYGKPLEIPIPKYDAHLELIKDKVKKVVDEVANYFKGIDYTPMLKSLENLNKAMQPIWDNIAQGWKWFVDSVLKPLTEWTITNLLPDFFNLLAGAIQFLGTIIEIAKPSLKWFWESVITPLASLTGWAITGLLQALTVVLKGLSDWAMANKDTLDFAFRVILSFFAGLLIYKTTKPVIDFMQSTGKALLEVASGTKTFADACSSSTGIIKNWYTAIGNGALYTFGLQLGMLAVAYAIFKLVQNWDKMNGIERFVGVLGALTAGVLALGLAFGVLNSAMTMGLAAAGIVAGISAIIWSITSAQNRAENEFKRSLKMPETKLPNIVLPSSLPKMAVGGVVSRPTIAQIGENGAEAIVPLERNTGWIDMLASKLTGNGQPINLTVKIGEDNIINRVIDGINNKTVEMGRGMVIV